MNKYLLRLTILFFFFCANILVSCKHGKNRVALPAEPDIKVADESIVVKRYEKALFSLDKNNLRQGMAAIEPEFSFFLGSDWRDTINMLRMYNYLNDNDIYNLFRLTQQVFPDITGIEKGLGKALNLYHQAYPDKNLPKVYTYVSGLDAENPVMFFDSVMVIGLDMFLGSNMEVYAKAGLPKYKAARFTPEHLLPECMLAVSDHLIKKEDKNISLLDFMVMAGKAMYFLDITLPDVPDGIKIGYSAEQLDWSRKNESNIWTFIIENQLLFSSDPKGVTKLMTDAPFTSGFGTNSPGRLGAYMGWQIVRKFMSRRGEDITLRQLMEETDARKILTDSGFKPGS